MCGLKLFSYIIFILFGYLSGSILWSKIIAKIFYNHDIVKENKDRNPGASNVFKTCGIFAGICALILDLLKGFIPVYSSLFFVSTENIMFSLIIAAPVLGHIFPIFFKFKGGKAIASSFGTLIGLSFVSIMPLIILVSLYIFFSVIIIFRPHTWRSVIVYVLFGFFSAFFVKNIYITAACVIIAVAVFLKHYISRDKNEPISVTFLPRFSDKKSIESEQ